MVYISDGKLHLTQGVHVFNTAHEEPIVVESGAILVFGGMSHAEIEVLNGGELVVKGMLGDLVRVSEGGRVFVAEGAWGLLPGKSYAWPLVAGHFVDPQIHGVGSTSVNPQSRLYLWDGIDTGTTAVAMRAGSF